MWLSALGSTQLTHTGPENGKLEHLATLFKIKDTMLSSVSVLARSVVFREITGVSLCLSSRAQTKKWLEGLVEKVSAQGTQQPASQGLRGLGTGPDADAGLRHRRLEKEGVLETERPHRPLPGHPMRKWQRRATRRRPVSQCPAAVTWA